MSGKNQQISRRSVLQLGGGVLGGMGLSRLLEAQALSAHAGADGASLQPKLATLAKLADFAAVGGRHRRDASQSVDRVAEGAHAVER